MHYLAASLSLVDTYLETPEEPTYNSSQLELEIAKIEDDRICFLLRDHYNSFRKATVVAAIIFESESDDIQSFCGAACRKFGGTMVTRPTSDGSESYAQFPVSAKDQILRAYFGLTLSDQ